MEPVTIKPLIGSKMVPVMITKIGGNTLLVGTDYNQTGGSTERTGG